MSILDYQKQELCPEIWDANQKLKPGVKSFIYKSIEGFFVDLNIREYSNFIIDAFIASSLASYFYREDTDLDVKIVIDIEALKKYNEGYTDYSYEEILDDYVHRGRESRWLTATIPGTTHPLDVYFYPQTEILADHLERFDGLYNVEDDEWIKKPTKFGKSISPSYVLNYAKDRAKKYLEKITGDIDQAKRDTIDFLLLKDYMKDLNKDDIKRLKVDFENSLEKVNDSIEDLMDDTEIIKNLRDKAFMKSNLEEDLEKLMGSINYSDGNLIFKVMQRYGYMKILVEIYKLIGDDGVQPIEVPSIYKVLAK
jgi:hypothetical protein